VCPLFEELPSPWSFTTAKSWEADRAEIGLGTQSQPRNRANRRSARRKEVGDVQEREVPATQRRHTNRGFETAVPTVLLYHNSCPGSRTPQPPTLPT
jgi:hypothetical protein